MKRFVMFYFMHCCPKGFVLLCMIFFYIYVKYKKIMWKLILLCKTSEFDVGEMVVSSRCRWNDNIFAVMEGDNLIKKWRAKRCTRPKSTIEEF